MFSKFRIQSLQSCPTLNHMTVSRWGRYCSFFKHDPRKTAREDVFQIDGFLVGLFPHQIYAAMWLIERWSQGVYTLFLADGMGVGKTSTVLLLWVIQRNVLLAWDEVVRCRKSPSAAERAKHLPEIQDDGSACPTNPFCIACPCENNSLTREFVPIFRPGPVLVVAPGGNVNVWYDECKARIDTKNKRLNLRWHVAYKELSLSNQVLTQLRCDIDTLEAKSGQERHLVISSNASFYNKVITPALQLRQLSKRKRETTETARHPITWSIMARDEYHTAKGVNTIMSEYFREARIGRPNERPNAPVSAHRNRPLKLAMSGTMFEGSPKDLLGHFVNAIDEEWTRSDPKMKDCTPQKLKELAKTYERIVVDLGSVTGDVDRQRMNRRITTYTRELNDQLSLFLIRRTGSSKFFDYTIVPLAPMDVMEIACQTQDEWLESIAEYAAQTQRELAASHANAVKNWELRGRQGPEPVLINSMSKSNHAYYLRLAADFAAIPYLHNKYPDWTFHADEIYNIDWDRVPNDNLYAQNLKTLVNSSTKILRLEKILARMRQRSEDWIAKGEQKEKMVLATAHPAALGILYLYFKEYKKDWKVVMVSASPRMDIEKRIQIVNGFCGRKDSPYYDSAFEADILLTTTPCVGTGLNLVAASNVVLFDLLWMRKDQEQAFCRVHRFPQERETKLYLLYSPGNPIERGCLERQRRRGQLGELTWQVTTGEAEAEQLKVQRKAERDARLLELEETV
jgi:hypothetical protein